MNNVYIASDNIISSLGFTTKENLTKITNNEIGINLIDDINLSPTNFYASLIDTVKLNSDFAQFDNHENYTRFEKLSLLSIKDALNKTKIDPENSKTLFILSTTKGNVDLLKSGKDDKRLFLWQTAKLISEYFGNPNVPVVISNACISGVLAINTGSRLIRSGKYENVIITGTDTATEFVVSGFNSFQSLSNSPCKPFDKERNGLSLGEACGTIILTSNKNLVNDEQAILVGGGSSANDANHISGPSRTGEGLYLTIQNTLKDKVSQMIDKIDFISAHGTATLYNDEMEAVAITRANMKDVPVNSFKGYWGHTLGAAGIIESIASVHSLKNNILYKTAGFKELGVTNKINIIDKNEEKELKTCLKIASGFGGCNAGILFYKEWKNN